MCLCLPTDFASATEILLEHVNAGKQAAKVWCVLLACAVSCWHMLHGHEGSRQHMRQAGKHAAVTKHVMTKGMWTKFRFPS